MNDDPYTKYNIHLGVTPQTMRAVYDKTEKLEYDEAVKKYNKLLADWNDYEARRNRGDEDLADYLPEEDPIEPVAPTATLPYFPGSSAIDEHGVEHKYVGKQPEWDYHTFIGWEIYPAYPDSAGAYELTLNGAITADVTAVAKWADAPARPFKEITFQKADGSGVFEKRFAIPTEFAYEPDNLLAGTDSVPWDDDDDPNTPDIYITYDVGNAKMDNGNPIILKYEDFQIRENYVRGGTGTITQNEPRVPVFTRDHYNVSDTPWKDSKGAAINPLGTNFETDAFVYQQWSPKQYIITFNGNGIGDTISSLNITLTDLDAPTVAQSGLVGTDKRLPTYAGTATVDNLTYYTFSHWMDNPEGGNTYTNKTQITGDTTLYAKWVVAGGAEYVFPVTGAVQTFMVPTAGTYTIEAWGAQGGGESDNTGFYDVGGFGGYSMGTISLTGGTLYVYVGSKGAAGAAGNNGGNGGNGGYNGGGNGGNGVNYKGGNGAGGGGGASDVRVVGGDWDNPDGLRSRIIVAGGGGSVGPGSARGGAGGGINGGAANNSLAGATQTDGNAFGIGGNGGNGRTSANDNGVEGRGAGGGGYYGGRGGETNNYFVTNSSGSGGSGYVKGITSGNSTMMSTAPEFTGLEFTGGVTTAGLHTGNGKVVITFIPQQN
ncbi:hypothetical protein AGMMS50212_00930 [Spirochaetia bacterium]|nr:hypothetical protein AGMMS50212_00930 [Spirochaetia bacterium]